jgi:maltose O-acetyltransferase
MPSPDTEKAKMLAGELYRSNDPDLEAERRRAKSLCNEYNRDVVHFNKTILRELFGYATDAYLEPPFFCDYGYNVHIGSNVYANHNFIILDCAPVTIGDNTLFGPNVVLSAAAHPVDPTVRASTLELASPIVIGANVWVGANVTVVAGVEIGDNTTIGANSVVTQSIPANCVAAGNPCRVIRRLDD